MRRIIVCSLIFCNAVASHAQAGAWLQKPGDGLVIAQATYFGSSEYFDTDGTLQPQPRFNKYELQPYGEYGVNRWLTVGGSAYLQKVHQSDHGNYGLGDPEAFARIGIMNDNTYGVISLQPLVKFPSIYHDSGNPRGASGSTDMELSLLYGLNYPLLDDRDYFDARIGYRERSKHLKPQWRADMAYGTYVTEHIQMISAVRYIAAAQEIDVSGFSENGEQDYDLLKTEVTTAYHLDDHRWVQATIFNHVAGTQTGSGTGFSLGYGEHF
jgi:hypothetical protein